MYKHSAHKTRILIAYITNAAGAVSDDVPRKDLFSDNTSFARYKIDTPKVTLFLTMLVSKIKITDTMKAADAASIGAVREEQSE